jgi:hypothetical protein
VKNRFQNLPFKFNLQRYTAVRDAAGSGSGGDGRALTSRVETFHVIVVRQNTFIDDSQYGACN